MSGRQLAGFARRLTQPKTANYAVTRQDVASIIVATGSNSWTLSLPAAASAGNGFIVTLKNAGTGRITIDPNGSETVNGLAAIGCYQQDSVDLICDGAGWQALFQSPFSIVAAGTTSLNVATIDLVLPSEFSLFHLELDGVEPVVSASLGLRLSNDGGSNFAISGYNWWGSYDSSSTTTSTTYRAAGSVFGATGFEVTPGTQVAGVGNFMSSRVTISPRSTGRNGGVRWETGMNIGTFRAGGWPSGLNLANLNAIRLIYNTGDIKAGARYNLVGQRGA